MKIRIYKIINIINKKVYIGKTKNPIKFRFKQHIYNSHNEDLRLDILNYGEINFKCSLICFCDNEDSDEKEKYWINFYDSTNSEKGYNKTIGGSGGDCMKFMNEDYKKIYSNNISSRMKDTWRNKDYIKRQKNASLGIIRSSETLDKMRAAMLIAQNRPKVKEAKRESQIRSIMNRKMIKIIGSYLY